MSHGEAEADNALNLRRRVRWLKLPVATALAGILLLLPFAIFLNQPAAAESASSQTARAQADIDRLRQEIERLEREQQRLEQNRRRTQSQINNLTKRERSLTSDLKALDAELVDTEQELEITELRLQDAEARLEETLAELAEAEERLAYREDLVGRRVRATAELGTVGVLDVLLTANSFRDFLTRFDMLREIIQYDLQVLAEVQEERQLILTQKERIELEREQILLLKSYFSELRQTIEVKTAQRRQTLNALQQDRQALEAALDEMEESNRQIERMLVDLSNQLANLLPNEVGRFIWPVHRTGYWRISSPFNPNRLHPILKTVRPHNGMDIAKPAGSDILAAGPGRVTYSGWYGGYGNTVIVSHTPTLSTLYAHASSLLVSVGQEVKAGDVIAKVGTTGLSSGPHLHFEVRVNGKPVDPAGYLP